MFYKKSCIALIIPFMLAACDEKSPSNGTIKSQLVKQLYANCNVISLSKFEKINGFPKEDGSFVDEIKYSFEYNPPHDIIEAVKNYGIENKKLTESVDSYKNIINLVSYDPCYAQKNIEIDKLSKSIDSFIEKNRDVGGRTDFIFYQLSNLNNYVKQESSNRPISVEELNYYIKDSINRITYSPDINTEVPDALVSEKIKLAISFLNELQKKIVEINKEENICFSSKDELKVKNRSEIESGMVSSENLSHLHQKYSDELNNLMYKHCKWDEHNSEDGIGYFLFKLKDFDSYTNSTTINVSRDVKLVKSDNGWVFP